jgi:4,5-dihydroxyphthalate decarboxylase
MSVLGHKQPLSSLAPERLLSAISNRSSFAFELHRLLQLSLPANRLILKSNLLDEANKMNYSRRNFLKAGTLAGTTLAMPAATAGDNSSPATATQSASQALDITIAGYNYDHCRALIDGRVQVEGCNTQFQPGRISDLNTHVFSGPQLLAVTEIGLVPFILAYANDDFRDYSLIPVFPLRTFRHKSIFIHTERGITKPEDLIGRRIGTPGYSSTSLTWIRGMMSDEYGVKPEDVEWVISAEDSSAETGGKASKQESVLPDGLSITVGPQGKDESDLLLDGDVDALFHAIEPRAYVEGHPNVKTLFDDPRATEREYFSRTGIFPIMHAVAMRNDAIEANPWLPEAVFMAYSQSKQVEYKSMQSRWVFGTLPWFGQELNETVELMGRNFWPYGVEPNRKTLNALMQYSYDQGLAKKRLQVEDLFHASTLDFVES